MRTSPDGELDTDDDVDDEELAPIWTSFQFDKKLAVSAAKAVAAAADAVDDFTLTSQASTAAYRTVG